MSWSYQYTPYNKPSTNPPLINKQQSTEKKQQNQSSPKFIEIDQIYQFTKSDEDYLQNLEDHFLKGKQMKISTKSDWRHKNEKDFRCKIYKLINELGKKINALQIKSVDINKEKEFSEKGKTLSELLSVLSRDMYIKKFDKTKQYLQSFQFQHYGKDLKYQIKNYIEQLNELQKMGIKLNQMTDSYNKFSVYKNIIQSLDDHKKLVRFVSYYQKNKVFDEQTMQKLITVISNLGEYQTLLKERNQVQLKKQTSPHKWLKHFLGIISSNFDQNKINQLQQQIDKLPNDNDSKDIMKTLKIYCQRKSKQARFMEKLGSMTAQTYDSVKETLQLVDKTQDQNLRRKFEDAFVKQLATQIIEIQNINSLKKGESYTIKLCNNYLNKTNPKKIQISQSSFYIQIESSKLLQIEQKLIRIEELLGSQQKKLNNKKFQNQTDTNIVNEIKTSRERISKFLMNENKSLTQSRSSLKSSQIQKSGIVDKKIITKNNLQQILNFRNDIQTALEKLKRSAIKINEYLNKSTIQICQIESKFLDQFTNTVTDKINKTHQIISTLLTQQQQKASQSFPRQNFSNQSLISLQQQLETQKIYSKNNIQENSKLKFQIKTLKETICKLKNQNDQLNKLKQQNLQLNKKLNTTQSYNLDWQIQYQKQDTQIKRLNGLVNQKERELIDFSQQIEQGKKLIKSSQYKISKSQNEIKQLQKQIETLKFQMLNLQKQSKQQITSLEFVITQKEKEIEILNSQCSKLKCGLTSKNSLPTKRNSLIKQLQEIEKQIELKIQQKQKLAVQKDQKLKRNAQLSNKKQQLPIINEDEKEDQQRKTNPFQTNKEQLEQESQKSQKRQPKFKPFNTNVQRDKSGIKNMAKNTVLSQKKTMQIPSSRSQEPAINALNVENINKKLPNINKMMEQNNEKQMKNNIVRLQEVQNKIDQLQNQVKILIKGSQQLKKQIKDLTDQIEENPDEIKRLEKTINTLKEKNTSTLNLKETELQTVKKQKHSIELKLKQVTDQLQKYKSSSLIQKKTSNQFPGTRRLQRTLEDKNKQITQMDEQILAELSNQKNQKAVINASLKNLQIEKERICGQFSNFQKEKVTIIAQFQNLKKENANLKINLQSLQNELNKTKQTAQKKEEKVKISPMSDQLKQKEENFVKLETQKRQLKIKISTLQLDLKQKTQHCNELRQKYKKETINLNKKIQELQKQLNQTKEIVQKYEEELKAKPVSDQLKKKQENIKKLQAQKKEMKTKVLTLELDLEQKTQHCNELRQKYKKETINLKKKIQELSTTTPGFQSEINILKDEMKQKQEILKLKEQQIESFKIKITNLQNSFLTQKSEICNFEKQIKQLKKQNQSFERQLQRLHEQKNNFESENKLLKDKLRSERNANKEQTQKMKKDQLLQIKNLKLETARQVQEARKQIKSAELVQKLKANTETSSESTVILRMELERTKKDLEILQKNKLNLQNLMDQQKAQLTQLRDQLNIERKELIKAKNDINYMNNALEKLQSTLVLNKEGKKSIAAAIFDQYFQHQSLDRQSYKRYLLYDLIQKKTNKTIKKTKLIYTIDLLNKVNFHNYIDAKENLLVVIRTSKGSIFGAFSTSKLEKNFKESAGTTSFIYTFDSQKTIEHFNIDINKPLNVKSFDWDEFFFIFGNAEIRWRFGEKRVHSSFGINNAYYETKGKDVSILLKEGNTREVPIDQLEFYQVQFEKK